MVSRYHSMAWRTTGIHSSHSLHQRNLFRVPFKAPCRSSPHFLPQSVYLQGGGSRKHPLSSPTFRPGWNWHSLWRKGLGPIAKPPPIIPPQTAVLAFANTDYQSLLGQSESGPVAGHPPAFPTRPLTRAQRVQPKPWFSIPLPKFLHPVTHSQPNLLPSAVCSSFFLKSLSGPRKIQLSLPQHCAPSSPPP